MSNSKDDDAVVRCDWVGLFKQEFEAKIPLPMNAEAYGYLMLSKHGHIHFVAPKPSWYSGAESREITTSVGDVTDVRRVGKLASMRCAMASEPKRLIDARLSKTRYFIFFTGSIKGISGLENLIAHVPFVHHVGMLGVVLKNTWDNRGSQARGIEACETWFSVLTGTEDPSKLPLLVAP